jgi:hypothetical protein
MLSPAFSVHCLCLRHLRRALLTVGFPVLPASVPLPLLLLPSLQLCLCPSLSVSVPLPLYLSLLVSVSVSLSVSVSTRVGISSANPVHQVSLYPVPSNPRIL